MSSWSDDRTLEIPAFEQFKARVAKTDAVRLLTVYIVLVTFIPSTLIFAPLGGVGTPSLIFACLILLWYVISWLSGQLQPSGYGRLVRVSMLLFTLAILLSFVAAMTRDISEPEALAADSGLVWLAASAGLVIATTEAVTDYSRLEKLLRRIVACGTAIAAVGILQFFGIDLTQLIHIPGLSVNTAAQVVPLVRNGFIRPEGTATQPIEFGVVLAMLLPLAVQQAFNPAFGGRLRRWAPVALIGFTAPLTVSRSGIIGLGVALICLFPTWKPRRQRYALGVLIISIGAMHFLVRGLIGTFIGLFKGIFNGQDSSVTARTADYSGVYHYVAQRPIFGRGFGTFLPELYRFTDNMYLQAIVTIGVAGLLVMFFLFIAGMQSAAMGRRRAVNERYREIGQALFASMAVAMATSATFDSLTFPMFSGLFFVLLGCCGAYRGIMTSGSQEPVLRPIGSNDLATVGGIPNPRPEP
jgi:polysaccharide biosynthesis protein PslJ